MDGWYWMNCGGQELFRYTEEALHAWAAKGVEVTDKPYVDYQVVRLWEDLLQMLPDILNPIPQNLLQIMEPGFNAYKWREQVAEFVFNEDKKISPPTETQFDLATTWWQVRKLDVLHLQNGPRIWFWTDGTTMFIRWDNSDLCLDEQPMWASTKGTLTMPLQVFIEEVHSFDRHLINAMAERVQAIEQSGSGSNPHIDINALVNEQRERATWLAIASERAKNTKSTPWKETVAAIKYFEDLGFAPPSVS